MTDIDPRKRPMEYQLDQAKEAFPAGLLTGQRDDLQLRALCRIADTLSAIERKIH